MVCLLSTLYNDVVPTTSAIHLQTGEENYYIQRKEGKEVDVPGLLNIKL
jgi:hypothetical protein